MRIEWSTWRHLARGALRQIWRYRLRSALVIACAALGVAGAITSVNYASGGRLQVMEKIRRLGTHVIVINAEQSRAEGGRARTGQIVTTLQEPDYLAIRREIDDSEIDFLRNVLDAYMPGAGGVEVRRITCMCTYTPDDNFVVDRHPEHEQVFLGCGFCGRGYKFAAVMGEILADLAAEGKTSHDISFLSAARFSAGVATD